MTSAPETVPSGLALPTLVGGRYRVLRRIGQGSIAQVVEARDVHTGAAVALKVLYPNLRLDPAVADRFRREVQVVRRIAHPNVVRIDDLMEVDDLLVLVMELHPGGDLSERLDRRGPLDPAGLRALCRQVCGALEAAHRAGVVHRDVKPQNILVGEGDGLDTRLCDFGLARTADLAGLTTRSTVLGTPAYMAPEVISEAHADPRSDLYSLGVVLFEAATGRLPFQADSPYQLLRHHLATSPPRASSLVPSLPAELDELIARALAKEPLDRFASAADMAAASEGALVPRPASHLARATCPTCGGEVVAGAGVCVDCGRTSLRLETEPGGVAVLVTGPGEPAEKLDGRSHVALVALLDELPAGTADFQALRARPPRLPFYCAAQLTLASAEGLVGRLGEAGLEARVEPRTGLGPREVRAKVRRMLGRVLVAGVGGIWGGLAMSFSRAHSAAFLPMTLIGLAAIPALAPVLASLKPVLRLEPDPARPPGARLAATLGALGRREDRRLVARILDGLASATRLGAASIVEPLLDRAATAAEGLIEADRAAAALDGPALERAAALGQDVSGALDRLRTTERQRGVLVADLLRTFSRIDLLSLKLARVAGLDAAGGARLVAGEIASLEAELAAEVELTRLLEGPP